MFREYLQITPCRGDIKKVELILNVVNPKLNNPVPDPYFGGEDGFENVYKLLDEACNHIIINISNRNL